MNRKVFIRSFGCQMNKLDTSLVTSALEQSGYEIVDDIKDGDAIIINTCSVREHAEERVFSNLGYIKSLKAKRADLTVVIMGCMAQRLGEKLMEDGVVDVVCGPNEIPAIPGLIRKHIQNRQRSVAVTKDIRRKSENNQGLDEFECAYSGVDSNIPGQTFVRVMRGCDNFCTYCIVPYVRGPEVSRPPEKIVEQITNLARKGVKQVTLLGQAVNLYEYRIGERTYYLADLLELVNEIEAIEWIKFVTSYPTSKGYDELLEAMRDLRKVCGYLHLPAQSGSDKILKAMNRKYNPSQYLEMIQKAKEKVPRISLAGDFIVGFPGESDEDFAATVSLVKQAGYKNCFVFKYSPRPGTIAARRLKDDVPQEVKKRRNIELLSIQEKQSSKLSRRFQDSKVRVLVEGLSKKAHSKGTMGSSERQLVGRTAGEWIVIFDGPESLAGEFADVKITKTSPLTLFGELVKQ